MSKPLLAFCLGLLGFFLSFVAAGAGLLAAFILVGAYFFICQFLLSRGNVNAYRKDWPIMLAMNATFLVIVVIMALVEKQEVVISQGPGFLISCCVGTYAGAVAASITARRKAMR
jgi:uncharacterized membrane protein YfcA